MAATAIVTDGLQLSLAGYHVNFDNRLLQYNPCPTDLQQNPGCGNSFHNAGSVTSNGAELGVQWQPLPWLNWYNSASYDETTYDQDLNFCTTTCVLYATAGKQQVDTPKQLYSSVLTVKQDGFWASLQGKFTGRRYYTYTNDQGFGGYTTFDLGLGYDFGAFGCAERREAGAERHQPDRPALCRELRQQRVRAERSHRHHPGGPRLGAAAVLPDLRRGIVSACAPRWSCCVFCPIFAGAFAGEADSGRRGAHSRRCAGLPGRDAGRFRLGHDAGARKLARSGQRLSPPSCSCCRTAAGTPPAPPTIAPGCRNSTWR